MKKTFKVTQIIPSMTYVVYHVEANNEQEAQQMIDNQDKSIIKISEFSEDNEWERIEYDVEKIS